MPTDHLDRHLLFGVLALQAGLLPAPQFVEAVALWATRKDTPLADVLVAQGWLTAAERALLDSLLECQLRRYCGDAQAGLAAVTTSDARQALAAVADEQVRQSLTCLPTAEGPGLPTTVEQVPESGDRYTLVRLHAT